MKLNYTEQISFLNQLNGHPRSWTNEPCPKKVFFGMWRQPDGMILSNASNRRNHVARDNLETRRGLSTEKDSNDYKDRQYADENRAPESSRLKFYY